MDHEAILKARNRTKVRKNIFLYQAMAELMRTTGMTASEFCFAASAIMLKKLGKYMPYITEKDNRIINGLEVCITHKK